VAPGVYGPHHQHFFNVRLDMAVDGPANRVYEVNPVALPEGPDNPVGNAWRAEEVLITSEAAGARSADPLGGRYWKVINNHVPNELGHPPGYKLVPDHAIAAFCHPGSAVARRAGALVHVRHQSRGPPGGLAGDAGASDRLPARPVRVLRGQPGPGQPGAM
jgi:primary-amine oxidase